MKLLYVVPRQRAPMLIAIVAVIATTAAGKRVEGRSTLNAGQALVVTKFCFDYNPACSGSSGCSDDEKPGMFHISAFSGKRLVKAESSEEEEDFEEPSPTKKGPTEEFHVALLDDEYFSFPEVSQVWGEANCSDVLKAAKKSFPLKWDLMKTEGGVQVESVIVEHLRPRWWYIALVSCSKSDVEVSYQMHLENKLRGWEVEFSMDQRGTFAMVLISCVIFAGLVAVQGASMQKWRVITKRERWSEVHPALLFLSASTLLALIGSAATFVYYWYFQQSGEAPEVWAIAGKAGLIGSKTLLTTLLMLLAHGECVCSPVISWERHREVAFGMALYGCLQFPLELWGESEYRNSTTEYIYDTRPGVVLVAFDCLWLWMYVSRSWQTFQKETRLKPRNFYKTYGPIFFIWYLTLPFLALIARSLAPHVRASITSTIASCTHLFAQAVIVHTFRPSVAVDLYDIKESTYETVQNDEELKGMLDSTDDADDFI